MKYLSSYVLITCAVLFLFACGKDEDPTPTPTPNPDTPISSFQFAISETDFFEVTFSNFSQNATSYEWDFGDGNASTEENPVHTYSQGGDYVVELTAINGTNSRTSSKTVTITDPNDAIKDLTGETSKVWKLSRNIGEEEYPLIVGPDNRSEIWWAFGLNDPLGARPCLMEEEYIFNIDGTYEYNTKGQVFADFGIWDVTLEGNCVDDTDPSQMVSGNGDDLSAWGSGTFDFEYDVNNNTLTVIGLGAHLGLPKVGTNAEVSVPQPSVTYNVVSIDTEGSVDKLVLETTIDGGYWQINLVSYDNPNDEPGLGGTPPTASFTFEVNGNEVVFTNTSSFGESYLWDFGDGNTSTEESPTHTFSGDGFFAVSLTTSNPDGESKSYGNVLLSSTSSFSPEVLYGLGSKTWKLKPVFSALSVGPSIGSNEWFRTSVEDVEVRSCAFDDEYIFTDDGTFEYKANGDVWAEGYMGVDPPACVEESDLSTDASAWASGTHTFESGDDTNLGLPTVIVAGTGAFIGLPKAFNGGEYEAGPPVTDGSVTYYVLNYIKEANSETLVLTIDISENLDGTAFWTYTLESVQ